MDDRALVPFSHLLSRCVEEVKSLGEGHLALDTNKGFYRWAILGQGELREVQSVPGAEDFDPPIVAKNQTGTEPERPSLLRQDVVEETCWVPEMRFRTGKSRVFFPPPLVISEKELGQSQKSLRTFRTLRS